MQTMNRDDARQEVRARIPVKNYLQKAPRGGYICPWCGSGTGKNGTGALKVYAETNTFCCHACEKSGDVLDLYQKTTGADYNTALSLLAGELGITIDNRAAGSSSTPRKPEAQPKQEAPTAPAADYTAYYEECRKRIEDPRAVEYLQGRGISIGTAQKYWIGFDPEADPANAPGISEQRKKYPTPRVIIPTSKSHYVARAIDPDAKFKAPNPKGSVPGIFNAKALDGEEKIVFVVEGAFTALSVIESGADAIATNSTSNVSLLLARLKEKPTNARLVVAFDNDLESEKYERTRKKEAELIAGLQELCIPCKTAVNIHGKYKDANDRLIADPEGLKADIEAEISAAWQLPRLEVAQAATVEEPAPLAKIKPAENVAFYLDNGLLLGDIEKFRCEIKTGYDVLDKLSGGLYAGLYVVAAISSLGKTTFVHQMADQIAAQRLGRDENGNAAMLPGNDVLYFSLEQSRLEMITKSLARITAQNDMAKAVTSLSIRKGRITNAVEEAIIQYRESVGDRMNVIEGNFDCNISFIGDYVKEYMRKRGTKPVVIIDYLQILQPEVDSRGRQQSTKEAVDMTVTELKRLSREQGLTIIVICSVNRANYLTPIDFESLKESGSIEYTADVVWGLQLGILKDPSFDKDGEIKAKREKVRQAKAENPRDISLVCLKNRYGIANFSIGFEYYPANDWFREKPGAMEWADTIEDAKKKKRPAGRMV